MRSWPTGTEVTQPRAMGGCACIRIWFPLDLINRSRRSCCSHALRRRTSSRVAIRGPRGGGAEMAQAELTPQKRPTRRSLAARHHARRLAGCSSAGVSSAGRAPPARRGQEVIRGDLQQKCVLGVTGNPTLLRALAPHAAQNRLMECHRSSWAFPSQGEPIAGESGPVAVSRTRRPRCSLSVGACGSADEVSVPLFKIAIRTEPIGAISARVEGRTTSVALVVTRVVADDVHSYVGVPVPVL